VSVSLVSLSGNVRVRAAVVSLVWSKYLVGTLKGMCRAAASETWMDEDALCLQQWHK